MIASLRMGHRISSSALFLSPFFDESGSEVFLRASMNVSGFKGTPKLLIVFRDAIKEGSPRALKTEYGRLEMSREDSISGIHSPADPLC